MTKSLAKSSSLLLLVVVVVTLLLLEEVSASTKTPPTSVISVITKTKKSGKKETKPLPHWTDLSFKPDVEDPTSSTTTTNKGLVPLVSNADNENPLRICLLVEPSPLTYGTFSRRVVSCRVFSCWWCIGGVQYLSVYHMCVQAMTLEEFNYRHFHDCHPTTFWPFILSQILPPMTTYFSHSLTHTRLYRI